MVIMSTHSNPLTSIIVCYTLYWVTHTALPSEENAKD